MIKGSPSRFAIALLALVIAVPLMACNQRPVLSDAASGAPAIPSDGSVIRQTPEAGWGPDALAESRGYVVRTVTGMPHEREPRDGPARTARFRIIRALAAAPNGDLYIADDSPLRVLSGGVVKTIAKVVAESSSLPPRDGPLATAQFNWISALAVDRRGELFVLETSASDNGARIRRVTHGQVTTVMVSPIGGYRDGPLAQALFYSPYGFDVDSEGGLVIADTKSQRIRHILGGSGTTLAGLGPIGSRDGAALQAKFNWPYDVALAGNKIYIADRLNDRIRMLNRGRVSTVAGSESQGYADGPALQAQLHAPDQIVADTQGVVYFSGENYRVRYLDKGRVATLAGTGASAYRDGPARKAAFIDIGPLAIDARDRIYVGDVEAIRVIERVTSR